MRSALILIFFWFSCVKSTKQTVYGANNQYPDSNSTCNQQTNEWCSEQGGFMCYHENKCVYNSNLCDGFSECEDGSDELNCPVQLTKRKDSNLSEEGFRMGSCADAGMFVCRPNNCEASLCLPMNATCNGTKDCPLGEDEEDWCAECATKPCHHFCEKSLHGAYCNCRKGFELAMDGISCEDIDECSTGTDSCQQLCENTVGSFLCKCASGYKLEEDGRSCRLEDNIDPEGYLLVSSNREVGQVPLPQYRNESVFVLSQKLTGKGDIQSISYFNRDNTIVMAISEQFTVQRIGWDTSNGTLAISHNQKITILRKTPLGIGSLSVDWIDKNVFLTLNDKYTVEGVGIFVCNLNGRFCRLLVEGEMHRRAFENVVVHSTRGLILWIDRNKWDRHSKILMSNKDGSNVQVLIEEDIKNLHRIAVDHIRNDIYFSDAARHVIERINIETKHRSFVVSYNVSQQSEMVFFNGFLYWTEKEEGTLITFDVVRKVFTTRRTRVHSHLALNHSLYQPEPASNPCSELDCPWICVAVPGTDLSLIAKCLCPDGYEESPTESTCIPSQIDEHALESGFGFAHETMSELCRIGMGCNGNGNCRELYTDEGKLNRIICDCQDPYDGEFCERLNMNKLAEMKRNHGWNGLVLLVPIILLIAAGTLIFCCFTRWTLLCGNGSEQSKFKINASIANKTEIQNSKLHSPSSYNNPNYLCIAKTSLCSTSSTLAESSL